MVFLKFRSRHPESGDTRGSAANVDAAPAESMEAMRRRAKYRLLGAAVLVILGIVCFPLLFNTQPRPVSVDTRIEIPDSKKMVSLAPPPASPASEGSVAPVEPKSPPSSGAVPSVAGRVTELPGRTQPPAAMDQPAAPADSSAKPVTEPVAEPVARPEPQPPKPQSKPSAPVKPPAPAKRPAPAKSPAPAKRPAPANPAASAKPSSAASAAQSAAASDDPIGAIVERVSHANRSTQAAKEAKAASNNSRFIVQVGSFSDRARSRQVGQKLESAGLKPWAHVVKNENSGGERIRMRLGPFNTRAEADKAAARVKALSLPAAVQSF